MGLPGRQFASCILGLIVFLVAAPALADTGMSFLDLGMMQLFVVGVFIVALEAFIIKRELKISFGGVVGLVGVVNFLSYLAGLPILWLISTEGPLYVLINQHRNPLLSLGMMLAAFVITMLVETPLFILGLKVGKRAAFKACLTANVVSYIVLIFLTFPLSYFPDNGVRHLFNVSSEQEQE